MTTDIKTEIGHRVRQERERHKIDERRGLWTESDLIIKQLMRTELGQSLPTITKLQYLSKRLEVPIDTFLENKELALPEEELLSLDLIERILDLIRTGTGSFAEDIFDDYFKQVTLKQVYTFNDLLLIDYFAMQCQDLIYRREH